MRVVIDTSSLLSLVKYYLPFDQDGRLLKFIERKITAKEIIVLDAVYKECRGTAKGIIVEKLTCITDKKNRHNTEELLPPTKLFHHVEQDFANAMQKRRLTPEQFESLKDTYMESADFKLVLFALLEKGNLDDEVIVVTEESATSNDNKAFKKIPAICGLSGINITCWDLPKFLKEVEGIDFAVK